MYARGCVSALVSFLFNGPTSSLSNRLISFTFHFMRHFIWPIFDLSIYGRSIYMATTSKSVAAWQLVCTHFVGVFYGGGCCYCYYWLMPSSDFHLWGKLWTRRWFFSSRTPHLKLPPPDLATPKPHILFSNHFDFGFNKNSYNNKQKTLLSSFSYDLLWNWRVFFHCITFCQHTPFGVPLSRRKWARATIQQINEQTNTTDLFLFLFIRTKVGQTEL